MMSGANTFTSIRSPTAQGNAAIHQTAAVQPSLSGGLSAYSKLLLSAYSKLLLFIASNLIYEECSQLKLALCADSHVKICDQDSLKNMTNTADILNFMVMKKLISWDNLTLISDILKHLGREDLREKISEYENSVQCKENDDSPNELPDSQESMKSLSDDEKLERSVWKLYENKLHA